MKNILIEIAKECKDAYCVSPQTVQDAVNREIPKQFILEAIIEINQKRPEGFYIEDFDCCLFTADFYKKE
jgi:hypothetical protein